MGSFGFWGIFYESMRVMGNRGKQFLLFTMAFVLPTSILNITFSHFYHNTTNQNNPGSLLLVLSFLILFTIFYLSSTAAITYTTFISFLDLHVGGNIVDVDAIVLASLGSIKTIFRSLRHSLPRLALTMICIFLLNLLISIAFTFLAIILGLLSHFAGASPEIGVTLAYFLLIILTLYLTTIWCLTTVVPVLEHSCWWTAVKKSQTLIQGKKCLAFFITLVLTLVFIVIEWLSLYVVSTPTIERKVSSGIAFVIVNCMWTSYSQTLLTVLYIDCKKHHNEPFHGVTSSFLHYHPANQV